MELVTVLTPTYNRAGGIQRLYQSLCAQTDKEFKWLIVDDGSTDNTKTVISEYAAVSDFSITYVNKKNGGKHTAINVGVRQINTPLTFIVDSDDSLAADAIAIIRTYWEKYKEHSELCGLSFLRMFQDGTINGKEFVPNELIASYIESRVNADDTHSDKAEVFVTRCLKEFPFPEYPNEKFLGEDIVWIRMARKYSMVHINKPIYVGEYQNDGLTKNRRRHNIKTPVGCMNRAQEFMMPDIHIRYRLKGSLQFIVYGKFAGYKLGHLISNAPDKGLALVATVPGLILYERWKREYKKQT